MKLVSTYNNRLVDLEGVRSLSVELLGEEFVEAHGLRHEMNDRKIFGLWANFDEEAGDCELLWHGTQTDCNGRLNYIARKNAALDLKVMP